MAQTHSGICRRSHWPNLCKVGQKREGADLVRHGLEIVRGEVNNNQGTTGAFYFGTELMWTAAEGLNLAGRRGEAIAVGLEAIRMVEKTAEGSPQDSNPRLRLAAWYELLGDLEARYAADAKKMKATNHAHLIDARRWYQKVSILCEMWRVASSTLQHARKSKGKQSARSCASVMLI